MFLLANISWLEEGPFALYRWEALFQDWRIFGQAFLYTILLSLGAILVAFALGIFFGSLSATKSKLLHAISRVYVEFFSKHTFVDSIYRSLLWLSSAKPAAFIFYYYDCHSVCRPLSWRLHF